MNIIKNNSNFIKQGSYIYDTSSYRVIGAPQPAKIEGPIIKAHQTALSYAEKYRLGILTYPEYLMWQAQISLGLADTTTQNNDSPVNESTASTTSDSSGRFWENDSGIRQNVSEDAYADFLRENSIDVSNNTTLDIQGLLDSNAATESEPEPPADFEPDINEVLKNVNKDIKGDTVLSEEEIAALFAAAGV